MVYVELRAAFGSTWADALPKDSEARQLGDDAFQYMATPDAENRLAYTDAYPLFRITLEHWDQFARALPSKGVWAGRIEELRAIRNRIGHCRRPHMDDLARLEQTLRDLETGAFTATSAFNCQRRVEETWDDAVVDGWVQQHHETAVRLIEHARNQYDTLFTLMYSKRPWTVSVGDKTSISGIPGYLWHASWHFRGGRPFDLATFWRDISPWHNLLVFVCADRSSISISFSAKEDPEAVADAIGYCFDAALFSLGKGLRDSDFNAWKTCYADLDARVHISTAWSIVEESMRSRISIFGA